MANLISQVKPFNASEASIPDYGLRASAIQYGTCPTAAGTAAKTVTCATFLSTYLTEGAIVAVKFSNTNSAAVGNLTLNVNSTGAKPIKYIYNGNLSNLPAVGYLKANQIYLFYYDGTNWVTLLNYDTNDVSALDVSVPNPLTTANWGNDVTVGTVDSVTLGFKMPAYPGKATQVATTASDTGDLRVLLSTSANDTEETDNVKKDSDLKYNPSTNNLSVTKINGVTVGNSPKFTDTLPPTVDIPSTTPTLTFGGETTLMTYGGTAVKIKMPTETPQTHYTAKLYAGASNGSANATTTNNNTHLILTDNDTATTRVKVIGTGTTTVTSDSSGTITINSVDDYDGTVTEVKAGPGLNVGTSDVAESATKSSITTGGTLRLTTTGVTAGTYQGITVDKYGRVTAASNQGYVTSSGVTKVRVQATSPVVSSQNTEQTSSLNTTISLADAYGDTKNPYDTKHPHTVLAGPSTGTGAADAQLPTFRALVAEDLPNIGSITNAGAITSETTMVTSDGIVFTDASDSNKIKRSPMTAGVSTLINSLGEGTSPANRNDYIVAQYANGGTTTITYHRRKLSNIFAALDSSDIVSALGYTPYNAENPSGYTNTSVKGNAETTYRTGQVNLTPANLGISATTTSVTVGSTTFNKYTHPTSAGNKHVPAGGSSGQFLGWDSAGTAKWVDDPTANIANAMVFKGTVGKASGGTGTVNALPDEVRIGDTYKIVDENKSIGATYSTTGAAVTAKVGDTIVATATTPKWTVIPSGDEPSGTVTSVAAGVGLTTASGSAISSSGTVKAKLRSETALTNASAAATETSGRVYPVAVDKDGYLAVNVPWTNVNSGYLANTNTGAADRPIYITGNTPTQTTYRMAGTNATATTARAITDNLETGIWYVNGTSSTDLYSQSDGVAYVNKYNDNWIGEIYQDYRTGQLAVRGKNNGTWQAWRKILDSTNYSTWAATKGHTHTTSLAAGGTATVNLSANTAYTLTAGGTTVVFKTPADGNTDTKVNVVARGTTKSYLMADTTSPTSTAAAHTAVAETGIYMTTTAGELNATQYKVNEAVILQYNSTTKSLDFIFA